MNRKVILIALFFALLVGILIIKDSIVLDCNKIDSSFSISGINVKNICIHNEERMKQEKIPALVFGSLTFCDELKEKPTFFSGNDYCHPSYYDIESRKNIESNCYEPLVSVMSDCYISFAVAKQDEAICDTEPKDINFEDNYCYRAVAEAKRNESICEKIHNDAAQKAGCIFDTAILKNDPNVCMGIENPLNIQDCGFIGSSYCYVFNKDICVAAVTGDKTLCESVKALTPEYDSDAKNSCYEVVSKK